MKMLDVLFPFSYSEIVNAIEGHEGKVAYLVSGFGCIDNKDGRIMSNQDFDVSAERKLWRNDCPAVRWSVESGVCQEKW